MTQGISGSSNFGEAQFDAGSAPPNSPKASENRNAFGRRDDVLGVYDLFRPNGAITRPAWLTDTTTSTLSEAASRLTSELVHNRPAAVRQLGAGVLQPGAFVDSSTIVDSVWKKPSA